MNKRIETAMDKAARISDRTHQGHILEEPESKFEADIQDIIGILMEAEAHCHDYHPTMSIPLLVKARSKLLALAKEERER